MTNKERLIDKLNALINRYGGIEGVKRNWDKIPKTTKRFICQSDKLRSKFDVDGWITCPKNSFVFKSHG